MPKRGITFTGPQILALLGLESPAKLKSQAELTGKPCCSYCDRPLDPTTTTLGQGPLRRTIESEAIHDSISGKVVGFEEKIKFSSSRLVACPGCCLRLAEKYVRDEKGGIVLGRSGEPLTTGVKTIFPAFD